MYFLFEKIKELTKSDSIKRPEENYKFVFKRCLKHMKEEFKAGQGKKLSKKDIERTFYEHYFRRVVEEEKVPLESFFHPKNSKAKTSHCPKTINNVYVENISKSPEFVRDFTGYLTQDLEGEYREVIDAKLNGLVQRWENEYQESRNGEEVIRNICQNIEKNKKFKLPWTVREVQEAVMSVRKLFDLNQRK